MTNALSVNLAGMTWQTPLCLASGHAGFAHELANIRGFPFDSIGAICLKGTTLNPSEGNAMERVWETPSGLINSVGLENPGVEAVIEHHLPKLSNLPAHLNIIANVCGHSIEDYVQVVQLFDQTSVQAIEINISCPNIKHGGAIFGNDPILAAEVISACRNATQKPIIAKLSPNQTSIAKTAEHCILAGANILSAVNTYSGLVVDIETRKSVLGGFSGGVSGPSIQPMALLKVHEIWQVARAHHVPIIGLGGIGSAEDVLAFFMAGASACAIGTAIANDVMTAKNICQNLQKWMSDRGIYHLSELTGTLQS